MGLISKRTVWKVVWVVVWVGFALIVYYTHKSLIVGSSVENPNLSTNFIVGCAVTGVILAGATFATLLGSHRPSWCQSVIDCLSCCGCLRRLCASMKEQCTCCSSICGESSTDSDFGDVHNTTTEEGEVLQREDTGVTVITPTAPPELAPTAPPEFIDDMATHREPLAPPPNRTPRGPFHGLADIHRPEHSPQPSPRSRSEVRGGQHPGVRPPGGQGSRDHVSISLPPPSYGDVVGEGETPITPPPDYSELYHARPTYP